MCDHLNVKFVNNVLFRLCSWDPSSFIIQWLLGTLSLGAWSILGTSTPPYVYVVWYLIKHRLELLLIIITIITYLYITLMNVTCPTS